MSCACDTTPQPVGRYDGQIPQGSTWTKTITWRTGPTPSPVNLTGYTARMQLQSFSHATVLLTTENGRITLGGSAGTITLLLDSATTAGLAVATYAYALDLFQGANTYPLLEGFLTVTPRPTI